MLFYPLLKSKTNLGTNELDMMAYFYIIKSWLNIWHCGTYSILQHFSELISISDVIIINPKTPALHMQGKKAAEVRSGPFQKRWEILSQSQTSIHLKFFFLF